MSGKNAILHFLCVIIFNLLTHANAFKSSLNGILFITFKRSFKASILKTLPSNNASEVSRETSTKTIEG